ncbi:MAG: hypothetical protein ACXVLX_22125, partial [Ilumatobacteraceae bacterium]
MSMLVLVTCVWLLARGRRRENALSLSMGAHPIRLGLLTGVEQLIPVVVGIAATYAMVRWWPSVVAGSGAIDSESIDRALRSVEWALPLVVIAVV